MKLNSLYTYLLFVSLALLCSCTSSKTLTKEIRTMRTSLGYELTTKEYQSKIYADIYLDKLNGAGLVPMTTVKRKGTTVVPLILINYVGEKFCATLGETSLESPYRKFLTEALLAECNSSACFSLYEKEKNMPSDSLYILDIEVNQCTTTSDIKLNNTSFLWVDVFTGNGDMQTVFNGKVRPAISELTFCITLKKGGKTIHSKNFTVKHQQYFEQHNLGDSYMANQACLDNMAEGLSQATKEMVEEIAKDLSIVIMGTVYN